MRVPHETASRGGRKGQIQTRAGSKRVASEKFGGGEALAALELEGFEN
jgi:hypothetical protein